MASEARADSLRARHADLDARIHAEMARPWHDSVRIRQMKLEKLRLKEELDGLTRH